MRPITFRDQPQWSVNDDACKTAYIERIVQDYLIPKYSSNDDWSGFYEFLSGRPSFQKSDHYFRYLSTFGEIATQLRGISDKTIVETGGASPITVFLANSNRCFSTESDLRVSIDVPSDFADLVISLEVIEHIKDVPERDFSEVVLFQGSGTRSFASEVHRITKPGGGLVLTTPNTCSYKSIANAVDHKAPYVFRGHVREYSKEELLGMFSQFRLERHITLFNFFLLGDAYKKWEDLFSTIGWSVADRGDDHFFFFSKLR